MATRWRSPPERVEGLRSSKSGKPQEFHDGGKLHAALPEAIAQVVAHGEVGQEQRVLENIANPALVNGQIDFCLAVKKRFTANSDAAAVGLLKAWQSN